MIRSAKYNILKISIEVKADREVVFTSLIKFLKSQLNKFHTLKLFLYETILI